MTFCRRNAFCFPNDAEEKMRKGKEKKAKSAFPMENTFEGDLEVKTEKNDQWRSKYFVLHNNFLLCGDDEYAQSLLASISLERCIVNQINDSNFQITLYSKKKYYFRGHILEVEKWVKYINAASTLTIKSIYRLRYHLSDNRLIAATHRVSQIEYAIKLVDKRQFHTKKLRTLFPQHIQILKTLDPNPHIVKLYDLFETRKYLYIIMEFIPGGSLFDVLINLKYKKYKNIIAKKSCKIIHGLASGMKYMHKMGIIFKNLRPQNIVCGDNTLNNVKISDYGICQLKTDKILPHYIAPEILANKQYDNSVDYWSFGIILYIFCCGYTPFDYELITDNQRSELLIYGYTKMFLSKYVKFTKTIPIEVLNIIIKYYSEMFKDQDWNHVNISTRMLIQKLLSENPINRANTDNILETDIKFYDYYVSSNGIKKSYNRLKQTVAKQYYGTSKGPIKNMLT